MTQSTTKAQGHQYLGTSLPGHRQAAPASPWLTASLTSLSPWSAVRWSVGRRAGAFMGAAVLKD